MRCHSVSEDFVILESQMFRVLRFECLLFCFGPISTLLALVSSMVPTLSQRTALTLWNENFESFISCTSKLVGHFPENVILWDLKSTLVSGWMPCLKEQKMVGKGDNILDILSFCDSTLIFQLSRKCNVVTKLLKNLQYASCLKERERSVNGWIKCN